MPAYLFRGRCLDCGRTRDVGKAGKKVGGSYNRAAALRRCNICPECARRLLEYVTPGHYSVSRWNVTGLRRIVTAEADAQHTAAGGP